MSDNIPFDIQMEIIKKVSDVKSLIQFRSVSKQWKSFIDSSEFIKGFGARHTQPHSHILSYRSLASVETKAKFICLVDDDIETFKVKQPDSAPFILSHLPAQYHCFEVVGASHGLLCLYGFHSGYHNWMVVIWNLCIRKSFSIVVHCYCPCLYGFGVCPITSDPTVVKVLGNNFNMSWQVEVFTLSSGVWNAIPSSNLPPQSIKLNTFTQVAIDRFIYWGARESTFNDDGEATNSYLVLSFDLITKEFKVLDLPDTLTKEVWSSCTVSKLRESLVVYGSIYINGAKCCSVWVMDHNSCFRKLFTIGARVYKILGFKKNGEIIFETHDGRFTTTDVYDPCSQQIKNLGILGEYRSIFMGSYEESLLLLDQLDSHISYDNN